MSKELEYQTDFKQDTQIINNYSQELPPLTEAERTQIAQAKARIARGIYTTEKERIKRTELFFAKEREKYASYMG